MQLSRYVTAGLLISALVSNTGVSATDAPKSLLQYAPPTDVLPNEVIKLEAIAAHHFNLEAPNDCAGNSFHKKEKKIFECQISKPGKNVISVYVCDDKNTFCRSENHTVTLPGPGSQGLAAALLTGKIKDRVSYRAAAPEDSKHPGWLNNLNLAKALARKKGQLILLNYSQEWCPACQQLEKEVFPTTAFRQESARFTKIYVNAKSADRTTVDLISKFKLYWTPTLILMTPKLEEIGRFVGFKKTQEFLSWLEDQSKYRNDPIEGAIARLENLEKNTNASERLASPEYWKLRRRVGLWSSAARKYKRGMELLVGLPEKTEREEFLESALYWASQQKDKKLFSGYFKKLVREQSATNPTSVTAWALYELKDLDKEQFKKAAPSLLKMLSQAIANYDPNVAEYKKRKLYSYKAKIYKALEQKQKTTLATTDYLAALKEEEPANAKEKFGQLVSRAFAYQRMGKDPEAQRLAEEMVKSNPSSYFAYTWSAIIFDRLKMPKRALSLRKKALPLAQGRARYRARLTLAKEALKAGNNAEAIKLIKDSLSIMQLPKWTDSYLHRFAQMARKLMAEATGEFKKPKKDPKKG